MTSDVQWQNYLNEATDAILTGDNVDSLRSRYGISYKDDASLIDLIENLDQSFETMQPSAKFTTHLKDELMGVERTGVVWRIRRLPARVQWAAIVTAAIGGVLIVVQRLVGASEQLHQEDSTRIPEEA